MIPSNSGLETLFLNGFLLENNLLSVDHALLQCYWRGAAVDVAAYELVVGRAHGVVSRG
jgi:hypothetical protein